MNIQNQLPASETCWTVLEWQGHAYKDYIWTKANE